MKDITPLHLFSTITAAAVHDVAHFGATNKYLCETNDPLAILYNYDSILERYHATTSFLVAKEKNCNIFESLSLQDQQTSQELIIKIILNTDMTKHNSLIDKLRKFTSLSDSLTSSVNFEDYLSIIVHMADLGNSSKPWAICHEWALRIMNEFYCLADKQRARNITVEYDITKLSFASSQIQFIEAVIKPMWLKWDQYIGYTSIQTINVNENLKMWHKLLT
jgi:high affinity cAMP-specific and IBMX-insensitive 3',5'-cyclic phosphodiesterase 8